MTPLPDTARLVLPDVTTMYPSVHTEEGLASVQRRLQTNPSPLGLSPDLVVKGLRICLKCNGVQFKEKFYLPQRGVAMGACHACDFSDIWMGEITAKHLDTCPVQTLYFQLYRDDGFDVLLNAEQDLGTFEDHLNNLHPNLQWTLKCGLEGSYLDLWLMIDNGRIEWRNHRKTPAVYVSPDSCHDPLVKKAIVKGVGQRLRINSSKTEYFLESVEETAKSFKICGYNYQNTKKELLKFEAEDPLTLIRKVKVCRTKPNKGVKAFYIAKYDPRMPHPRQLITRNYHHIENHPVLANLFPRENLVGGTKRLPNLAEMLSPTVQQGDHGTGGDGQDGAGDGGPPGRWNGSYHCQLYKKNQKCDVCSHMEETSTISSPYFGKRFAIHGRNIHLPASQKTKHRWFIYACEDLACGLIYVGSTVDVCARWASTKKACLDKNSINTGLYRHFRDGCPGDTGARDLSHLRWTLLDHLGTKLDRAGHQGGAKCRWSECNKLKNCEDKWICGLLLCSSISLSDQRIFLYK